MTTINLYQNQEDSQKKKSLLTLNKGFIFSLGIITLALLILGGLKVTAAVIAGRNQSSDQEIQKEKDSLDY